MSRTEGDGGDCLVVLGRFLVGVDYHERGDATAGFGRWFVMVAGSELGGIGMRVRNRWVRLDNHRRRNPSRPVDWRSRLGGELESLGWLPPRRAAHDPWVARVVRRRRGVGDPLIDAADAITRMEGFRWELEGRILAGSSFGEIANAMGMAAATVEAYEALHFNVVPLLSAESYVRTAVFGSRPWEGFDREDQGMIVKWAGFTGGVRLMEVVLARFGLGGANRPMPLAEDLRLDVDLWLAAMTLPVKWAERTMFMRVFALAEEVLGVSAVTTGGRFEWTAAGVEIDVFAMKRDSPGKSSAVASEDLSSVDLGVAGVSVNPGELVA